MATQAQLVTKVLSLLVVTPSGQPDSAEDVAVVEAAIPGFLGDLTARGIVYVPDVETFDDSLMQWLAMALSQRVANDFGRQFDPGTVQYAETMLKAQQQNWLPSTPVLLDEDCCGIESDY